MIKYFIIFDEVCLIHFLFKMDEYFIFESHDLGFILQEVYECLMCSYSLGHTHVRVSVRSDIAISYLMRWMPGWARRAGPGGVWKTSQGIAKVLLQYFS